MKKKFTVGILTGGGDCPGLNPAIKWIVKSVYDRSSEFDVKCYGIRDGWRGLIEFDPEYDILPSEKHFFGNHFVRELKVVDVRTWDRFGGTALGTSRTNPFKRGKDALLKFVNNIKHLNLDVLFAIGGEDTHTVLYKLYNKIYVEKEEPFSELNGLKLIGIPKTIDLDLPGTEYSLGFQTAVSIITEEIDRIRTTAGSHRRVFIVETMGRYAGHLALYGGIAAGAYIILIPEFPFNISRVVRLLSERKAKGVKYSIVVIAEGARPEGYKDFITEGNKNVRDDFRSKALGGVSKFLEKQIEKATDWEVRSVILSHLQRGGAPVAFDRRMGRLFGVAAVDFAFSGKNGIMVSYKHGDITSVSLDIFKEFAREDLTDEEKIKYLNRVTPDMYDVETYNGFRSFSQLEEFAEV